MFSAHETFGQLGFGSPGDLGPDVLSLRVDDGLPLPQTEGVGNQITFRISATQPLTASATCDILTVDGTAIAGTDYTKIGPPAQQVTIPVNPGYVDVTVDLLGPIAGWGPNRQFMLNISNPGGNVGGDTPIISRSNGLGIITDSSVEPTFTINPAGSPDPAEQNVDTNIKHNAGLNGSTTTHDVLVPFATRDGTATAGEDYVGKSGTATLTAGELTIDTQVDLIAGNTVNGVENYFVDLGNVTTNGYSLTVTNATSEGRIMEQGYLAPPENLVATTGSGSGEIDLTWDRGTP